jgi:hypothetical protein
VHLVVKHSALVEVVMLVLVEVVEVLFSQVKLVFGTVNCQNVVSNSEGESVLHAIIIAVFIIGPLLDQRLCNNCQAQRNMVGN